MCYSRGVGCCQTSGISFCPARLLKLPSSFSSLVFSAGPTYSQRKGCGFAFEAKQPGLLRSPCQKGERRSALSTAGCSLLAPGSLVPRIKRTSVIYHLVKASCRRTSRLGVFSPYTPKPQVTALGVQKGQAAAKVGGLRESPLCLEVGMPPSSPQLSCSYPPPASRPAVHPSVYPSPLQAPASPTRLPAGLH